MKINDNPTFGYGKQDTPGTDTSDIKKKLKTMDSWFYTRTSEDKKEFDMDMSQHMVKTDLEFVTKMIPHHKGAIMMSKSLIDKADKIPAELHKLISGIISSQSKEIELMKKLKKKYSKE